MANWSRLHSKVGAEIPEEVLGGPREGEEKDRPQSISLSPLAGAGEEDGQRVWSQLLSSIQGRDDQSVPSLPSHSAAPALCPPSPTPEPFFAHAPNAGGLPSPSQPCLII